MNISQKKAAVDSQRIFWERVKAKYGVSNHVKTMTLVHWRDCLSMISDLLNESEVSEKTQERDVGIGDIGASDTDIEMHGQAKADEAEGESNWARDIREARESETE